ncbi:MAG: UDP-N-acetylmuramoyl-tripeptide--D-alanyl-D-alanine ligase [Dysgonamonadaceae bacterium]|jgi:UDP-N-acetylmuramoyl-tripeptide--D-alanyl-D-alanine ligase|nr:UDP-N-acetylmuramoyl-tripeptide--D-alanyl-D-alanine ligase [Dysgonamonadaceae bacterium]
MNKQIDQLYEIFRQHPAVATDSRCCTGGAIFFALKGDRFDGNDYIGQALASGAVCAVGDRSDLPEDPRIIRTDNVLQTLQALARHHRQQMPATVIAVTGTNGKTTTKELAAAALSAQYKVLYTQGNLNNHIGVPLTLLQLRQEHAFAIIEMGANHPGEIRALCRIADPRYGLITNVGKAHLEGFGSLEGVVRAKTELYDFLREKHGTVFGNPGNRLLSAYYRTLQTISYGETPGAFVWGKILAAAPALDLEWQKGEETNRLSTRLAGAYNLENVLAAICIAAYFEVESGKINAAIAAYSPDNHRSQNRATDRNRLIIDAYNANPSSMQAALDNFTALPVAPKMVILGEMNELGACAREEHQRLVDRLNESPVTVRLVGKNFTECSALNPEWQLFANTTELINALQTAPPQGYHILVKGSRSNQLEKIIPYL